MGGCNKNKSSRYNRNKNRYDLVIEEGKFHNLSFIFKEEIFSRHFMIF